MPKLDGYVIVIGAAMMMLAGDAGADPALNRTPAPGEYRKPAETVAAMKLPDGFKVKLFAGEPDLVQPIAFCIDARARLWVVENLSYPTWAPKGHDRIVILEDTDGDGVCDSKKLFWDKGNFVSGIQIGFGGVWVGSPPNLLFIPDKDGDDKPDGPAQVLLDGWGHDDTHETLNSFLWGPDGWLYGCQGVFTQSKIGPPGSKPEQRTPLNACIWRYHPTKHQFEIFAEGGSNQWGFDYNDYGQAFMTACVIPHLYHVIQGGRYTRQGGQHFNPNTYIDIQTIRTNQHFAAAFAGALCYQGDNFPSMYRNELFFNNIHASKVHVDWLERKGSGYIGKFGPHDQPPEGGREGDRGTGFINNGDKWYRGLCLRTGPDGSIFINDWYDQRPCHQLVPHDQDLNFHTGRVYKVSYGEPKHLSGIDVGAMTDEQLVQLQLHRNDWWVRTARRTLQERHAVGKDLSNARAALAAIARDNPDATRKLRALWALHVTGGVDEAMTLAMLEDGQEYVRAWAIQLALEDHQASDALLTKMAKLAVSDPSPVVRLYLASACGRLPLAQRWAILEGLVSHADDDNDHNLPALYWYAIEPLVPADRDRALKLAGVCKLSKIRQFIARRAASAK